MEQVKTTILIHAQQLEDLPELLQHIQSLLPAKEAARTCVLSKSWLHAWSTIPSIRFTPSMDSLTEQNQTNYMSWIHRTVLSFQKFCPRASPSHHGCIIYFADEIFSSENLNTLSLKRIRPMKNDYRLDDSLRISIDSTINCVNLRVLELDSMHVSEEVLHVLLSTCKLLEKIDLMFLKHLKQIKVNNLRYLHELRLWFTEVDYLEIDDVPCLRYFDARGTSLSRPVLFKMETIGSLRELYLKNVPMDDAFFDMIESKFPCLESLTLSIKLGRVYIMNIRCVTLQSLKTEFWEEEQVEIQVYAPKLHSYGYTGCAVPSLLFPTIAPKQIQIYLLLKNPIDHLFFLKMRETLKLSSKFNIVINCFRCGVRLVPFNIDDVRSMVPFPATNVEELYFLQTDPNEGLWENSLIFDALFSICHPMYVNSDYELRLKVANYFLKLIVKGVMENCEIRNPLNGRWVTLTNSSLNLLCRNTPDNRTRFKISWCSP